MLTLRQLTVCAISCLIVVASGQGPVHAQDDGAKKEAIMEVAAQAAAKQKDPFAQSNKADSPKDSKGESKGDDSPKAAETKPARPPVDPEMIRLFLEDGAIISGKLAIKHLTIETDFGPLQVPITKIRRFQPGLNSYPGRAGKIAQLIAALAAAKFKDREQAGKDLLAMGLPVRKELGRFVSDSNAERVKRVKSIIEKLDELAENLEEEDERGPAQKSWIRDDLIETDDFTVVGKIGPQAFTVDSKYGKLRISLSDITTARREGSASASQTVRKSLAVEGQYLAQLRYKSCKIRLNRGDRVSIKAGGQISMTPWGTRAFSTPNGASNYGSFNIGDQRFSAGTLIAKIGSNGKVFKIGSNKKFTATGSGTLRFAIAMQSSYGRGNYQFPGQYDLKIKVDRAGEKK